RDAYRTAAVCALGERPHPGRDLPCRAAAGTAGAELAIPRIARRRTESAFGRRAAAEFGRGGFAKQDPSRFAQPHSELGIRAGTKILEVLRAHRRANVPRPGQVLERIRHAV